MCQTEKNTLLEFLDQHQKHLNPEALSKLAAMEVETKAQQAQIESLKNANADLTSKIVDLESALNVEYLRK